MLSIYVPKILQICLSFHSEIPQPELSHSSSYVVTLPTPSLSQDDVFLAGFEDCYSEAIRFLINDEQFTQDDTLVTGLQQYLGVQQSQLGQSLSLSESHSDQHDQKNHSELSHIKQITSDESQISTIHSCQTNSPDAHTAPDAVHQEIEFRLMQLVQMDPDDTDLVSLATEITDLLREDQSA